jgi:hypothetical protein
MASAPDRHRFFLRAERAAKPRMAARAERADQTTG